MPNSNNPRVTWDIELPDEDATRHLAMDLAIAIGPGDLITLAGDLGAGKTMLARAIIRYLAGDERLQVPSPTFTFLQTYELPRFSVVHADLYRVTTLAELAELGWQEAAEGAAVLLEWPDRAGALIQADRLEVSLALAPDLGPTHRNVRLTGFGAWGARLTQLRAARALLDATGYGSALRQHLQGDASIRSYERLYHDKIDEGTAVLMKVPLKSDEPALRQGRSYSAIAHLAENVRPFAALARALHKLGFSAPEIYAADLENGLLLLEDLGSEGFVAGDPPVPIEERYEAAIDLLVALHSMELPEVLPVAPRIDHRIPLYDLDALLIEVELLFDWYLPHRGRRVPDAATREAFLTLWRVKLGETMAEPKTWVLRDFHSPNLLWLPERTGIARVGLLDFQDAVLGPPAYDAAALLMDARVDVSEALELKLLSRYAIGRGAYDPAFDPALFASRYVMLGAQRATKILGIFARLDRRDRKPQYLRHLPRVWNYLMRALAHPSLAELKAWYRAHVPPPLPPTPTPVANAPVASAAATSPPLP
ncbi:MAG: tRNA (adenosine(37)-N6)-threonylcarbamoyltransferase complex ATPase subunit type 1 TsaE [Xanthobacteraceae bacterium]|nr:tRNA (adenosine(37)-N6)-threonylcarbamoyltransferase complex ATPase subunit type 1 TsaE [Xanthobacteraceae bacterium]